MSYKQAPSAKQRPPVPIAYSRRLKQDDIEFVGVESVISKWIVNCIYVTVTNNYYHGIVAEPTITKFPSNTTVTEGEGVYFKIKVSGEPQPTVTWYHDGEQVRVNYAREIEADGSLAIPSTELKHSGVYKAVVANQHGSEEREIKLTVDEEGGASAPVPIDDMVSSRPIPIPEFGSYVAELHANSNQRFKDLFEVSTIQWNLTINSGPTLISGHRSVLWKCVKNAWICTTHGSRTERL